MSLVQRNGQTVGTYSFNGLGQRVHKVATFPQNLTTDYDYDESGHLIGERTSGSTLDYVWLDGIPVAVVSKNLNGPSYAANINYIQGDALGTPRLVTNASGTEVWRRFHSGDAFGEQTPTSSTGFVLNLRFPGQYYDAEDGLSYNYFRDYDSTTGRYAQSDPIGLKGGTSTYAYVGDNPLSYTDPFGLFLWPWEQPVTVLGGTPAQQQEINGEVAQILGTPRGQQLLNQIDGPWYEHGSPQTISINNQNDDSSELGAGSVNVEPRDHPCIQTTAGRQPASTQRIIAHELGHAVTGTDDDGPGRLNNINQNENPIMNALGQPSRTSYY
jgi:RHS repeat-associated protein